MALETGADFTKSVMKRWEDIPDPRLREVMQSAIKHLHAFVSEVKPTGAEWFKAIQFLTAIGHKCDDKRQEFILASDVMGVSMLVDDINNRRVPGATFRHGRVFMEDINGASPGRTPLRPRMRHFDHEPLPLVSELGGVVSPVRGREPGEPARLAS